MNACTMELPLPPSANRLWRVTKRGRVYIDPKYRAWKLEAHGRKLMQKPSEGYPHFAGAFNLHIVLPEKTRCDPTNYIKALEDFLQEAGIVENDKRSRDTHLTRSGEVNKGFCRVFVMDARIIPA